MKRREFLAGTAVAAGSFVILGKGITAWSEVDAARRAKLERIAILSLCFNPVLKRAEHPDDANRTLDILDLPAMVVARYGVRRVEFQHTDFASTEDAYLAEFKHRMEQARAQFNQINLEFRELNVSSPDPVLRAESVDLSKRWVDHAVRLGCPRVMVNPGRLEPEVRPAAFAALKAIAAYAKPKGVFITLENKDNGNPRAPQASWQVVVEAIKAAGLWANPDVGNFPNEKEREAGLRVLYRLTAGSSHCHYDPAKYSEAMAIHISKEAGYTGIYAVEADASINGPDPYASVKTILEELLRDI